MTTRIPPSLKWLVTKRARIAGQIQKAEKALWKIEVAQQEIEVLKADLLSIDRTILLHDIPIDPARIPSLETRNAPHKFKHGGITKAIYKALRQAGNESLTTTQIRAAVALASTTELDYSELIELRYAVRKLLRRKFADGKVERLHPAKTCVEGRWRLKDWDGPARIGRPSTKA